jgi:hypothetical protein
MFRKWFQIAGTDTAHGNTTIRTYSANYERHYHAPHLSAMLVRESRLMRTGLVERIEHRPDLLALFRR